MSKPSLFIITSDFTTFKNDATSEVVQVTVPSGGSIAANGSYTVSADISIGKKGALMRGQVWSSKEGNDVYATQSLTVNRTGKVMGFDAPYPVTAFFWRRNASTVRCQVLIQNPYGETLTKESGSETFSFRLNTFVPPFV